MMMNARGFTGKFSKQDLFGLGYCILAVCFFGGCTRTTIEARFENSNQLFLEKTMASLDLGEKLDQTIPSGKSVSLVSLENDETNDRPVNVLVEDQIIQSLISSGYSVLERDMDTLTRMICEKSGDQFRLMYFPTDVVISSVGGAVGGSYSGSYSRGYAEGSASVTEVSGVGRDSIFVIETQLESADYLISYRILECGIVYRDSEMHRKKREAMVGLHVRVQETSSGKIVYADDVRGTLEDEIEEDLLYELENYHYSFYSHDLPVVKGVRTARKEVSSAEEKRKTGNRLLGALAGGVMVLWFFAQN